MFPTVSIITPTTADRNKWQPRLDTMVAMQNYPSIIEHIYIDGPETIGEKRNAGCQAATGDIIVHFDSDDVYGNEYVLHAVNALEDKHISGMSAAYFYHVHTKQAYLYHWPGSQPYVIESGMAYYRKTWETRQFKAKSDGEGILFQLGWKVGVIEAMDSFIATIHGDNISSHKNLHHMQKVPINILQNLSIFAYLKG